MSRRDSLRAAAVLAATALLLGPALPASAGPAHPAADSEAGSAPPPSSLPAVTPAPRQLERSGADAQLPHRVRVAVDADTDRAARELLVSQLRAHGVRRIDVVRPDSSAPDGGLTLRLGPASRADIARSLGGTRAPARAEGYALHVTTDGAGSTVALGGHDAAGQFYAVQTLRQLFVRTPEGHRIAGAAVEDEPSMALRGTIEGFYGPPWTHAERLDQMDFYGDVKANTYIYAPKDDPYHREKWREPYPADKLTELGELVNRAADNHVLFTFAVSPGGSICYSDPQHRADLEAKLQSLYDLGARAFSIPLDDISYTEWNCAADEAAYGAPGRKAAAEAQVDLLNDVQRDFVATHEGTRPLQMVPTEYGDLTDTAYKQTMRATLDPAVEVMWTGTQVVPPEITVDQAEAASELFGRKVFVWDNYPVNDFGNTSGRLLLAPYDHREAGLSAHLSGIVANPMNQPYASKVAVAGAAAFAWNDTGYDARHTWGEVMKYLAGGDARARDALLAFGDLNHLAPTFGEQPWQPQSPELARRTGEFLTTWDDGDRAGAIRALRPYAARLAGAPEVIRGGAVQAGFVADADPWLRATDHWGTALTEMVAALDAFRAGDEERAQELLGRSKAAQEKAHTVRTDPPRNSWGVVEPKIADGVLDTFLTEAEKRLG